MGSIIVKWQKFTTAKKVQKEIFIFCVCKDAWRLLKTCSSEWNLHGDLFTLVSLCLSVSEVACKYWPCLRSFWSRPTDVWQSYSLRKLCFTKNVSAIQWIQWVLHKYFISALQNYTDWLLEITDGASFVLYLYLYMFFLIQADALLLLQHGQFC